MWICDNCKNVIYIYTFEIGIWNIVTCGPVKIGLMRYVGVWQLEKCYMWLCENSCNIIYVPVKKVKIWHLLVGQMKKCDVVLWQLE